MNGPGDLPLQQYSSTPDTDNCSIISIIPTLGMSSCRGRAEAFARRLSSKLRTLGSQGDDDARSQEDEPIINGDAAPNTWVTGHDTEQTVTDLQPLRHEADSFFDFECELESPGSPVDECEYLRLIESTSNTPHNSAPESGYACASAASSHSSTDGPFYDVNSECEPGQLAAAGAASHHHAPAQSPQSPSSHASQPSFTCQSPAGEHDEVDCCPANKASPTLDSGNVSLCNGHEAISMSMSLSTCTESTQTADGQLISNNVTTALPSEGPDIEPEVPKMQKMLRQSEITPSLQDKILRELQRQSLEITDDELEQQKEQNNHKPDSNSSKPPLDDAQNTPHTPSATTTTCTLSNGHDHNGEEMLTIEVSESAVPADTDQAKERESPKPEEPRTVEPKAEVESTEAKASRLNTSAHHDTTDDEDDCRPQRVRRCSSLKTGKTPPGTPGRKKIVRFADVLGLDLADVKTFLDEIPTVPKSAYDDLEVLENEPPLQLGPKPDKLLMPLFQQPGGLPNFLDAVRAKQVSLENAAVTDSINHTITGSVRVRNLDFHKSVHIRYSLDGWRSYADLQANYVENSCDGFSDKFSFVLFGNSLHIGQRLEFAVRFQCKGQQYWDNNYGSNYCFQCLPTAATPALPPVLPSHHANNMPIGLLSPTAGEAWCSSFY